MQDIAKDLGLSVATVSRALRRVPGINSETRARVLDSASRIGYRLPQSYRVKSGEGASRLQHVGILLDASSASAPHPYLTGMSEASVALNASLSIHFVDPNNCESILEPKKQPRAMRSGLLSGLILIFWWPHDVVRALSEKLPTVSIMHKYAGLDVDMVGIDNEGGMEVLVGKLFEAGHRKIAFLGRCGKLHWANVRFGGYVSALTSLGLEYRPERVVDVAFETLASIATDWEKYAAQIDKVMSEGVTAWVCSSEPAGWFLHRYLTSKGYKVPQDVSVTGFHRPTAGEPNQADLTSVGASYEGIGAAALKRLCLRIQNPAETSRTILFPCEYYAGSTIGPAPAR